MIGTGKVHHYVELILANGPIKLAGESYDTSASVYKLYNHMASSENLLAERQMDKGRTMAIFSEVEKEEGLPIAAFTRKVIDTGKSDYTERSGVTECTANGRTIDSRYQKLDVAVAKLQVLRGSPRSCGKNE